MAINGASILIYANTGTVPSPVWTVVGSQRDVNIAESVAAIEASSKDSANRRVDAGRYSSTITLDALYVPTDAAYAALRTAFRGRTKILVRKYESGSAVEVADCVITEFPQTFPDQDASVASLTLEVDGGWTAV